MHYAMLTTTTINAGIVARNFRFRRGTLLSCPLDLVFFTLMQAHSIWKTLVSVFLVFETDIETHEMLLSGRRK